MRLDAKIDSKKTLLLSTDHELVGRDIWSDLCRPLVGYVLLFVQVTALEAKRTDLDPRARLRTLSSICQGSLGSLNPC
ncbi:hypothetical protein BDW62DRAFT_173463 [Aspergillus aurantiobrunneus]